MPTYQYACSKCGHEFELFQSMKDSAIEICPVEKCGQRRWGRGKVQRQVGTGAGIIFKGSGFYITDYRSEAYKSAAKKEKDGGPGTGTSETKKPAESAAPKTGSSDSASKPAATRKASES
jgi:putative FmdB family regulatory protein